MKLFLRAQPAIQRLAGPSTRLPPQLTSRIASRPAPRLCLSLAARQARPFSGTRNLAVDSNDDRKETGDLEPKFTETKPAETGSAEPDSTEAKLAETWSTETDSPETNSTETESADTNSTETKSVEANSTETGSTETSSAEETTSGETVANDGTAPKDEATYKLVKIPVGESTEYSSTRSEMFTKTRPPSRAVSVKPNPAENEKFNFPLLRRPRRISNKEAIISGGASGIGFAIAQRLAAEGVLCTLVGRNEERLRKAAETLSPLPPRTPDSPEAEPVSRQHRYFQADVCDPKAWRDLFQQTPNANYLINAAGITYRSLLAVFPADEIQRIYDVNLYGTTIGCRAALRAWARSHKAHGLPSEKPDRCIVNVSSVLAIQGGYGAAAYAASKAGVVALTRSLAQEAANRSVRCNVILPGYIQTRMTESLLSQETIKKIAVKRLGRPDEVADAVTFLIKNKYANNCTLNLDGGIF
ncbi:3-oxoacyl-acyl carrier protein reductase [Ophiostoma piceae UAMH 11346]|uniref:3-oxoacyl-acyl carrier protein reductase n=1 Tax=Ophiostoma piceae (strain UAMH 11346) TaxID=1262450 RepID=S3CM39_OPHP1|nr:3-oxoacyl-acyl carrier protein reductase [Ophiostoma piceae UAMH 11346]